MTTAVPAIAVVAALVIPAVIPAGAGAQDQVLEIRTTGEHRVRAGDTPDLAHALALIDARRKAVETGVAGLRAVPEIASVGLKPGHLEAFTAVLVRTAEQPVTAPLTPPAAGSAYHLELRATLNVREAVRRVVDLHRDTDAGEELARAWMEAERLRLQLSAPSPADPAGRGSAAQHDIVTAIEIQNRIAEAYAAFVRAEPATVGGRVSTPEGRERARRLAESARALAPESPDVHVLMGDLWLETEQATDAESAYRAALGSGPDSSRVRTKLAAALRLQGRFPEALDELAEALRLDPASARAHSDRAMILRADRKIADAIAAYREAIRLDPDASDAHNGLAVALANTGDLKSAVAHFREIIRVDPDSTIGYYNLAYALADLDLDVESAAALREVIRIYPDHYNARYNLGELFRLEQKFDDSATQFREYLRLAPDTPQNQRNITRARRFVQFFEDPDAPPLPQTPMMR